MNIKLRCISAPRKPFLFTEGKVYDEVTLTPKNKAGGTLKILNDKGRSDYKAFQFTKDKNVHSGGYVFKIILAPVV